MAKLSKKYHEYTIKELLEIVQTDPEFDSPAFQLYVQDFLTNHRVRLMTPEQVGGYFLLLLEAWKEPDCGLPNDEDILAEFSRLKTSWAANSRIILQRFKLIDYKWYNKKLLFERAKQVLNRINKVKAGVISGQKRHEKTVEQMKNTRLTRAEQPEEEEEKEKEEETEREAIDW